MKKTEGKKVIIIYIRFFYLSAGIPNSNILTIAARVQGLMVFPTYAGCLIKIICAETSPVKFLKGLLETEIGWFYMFLLCLASGLLRDRFGNYRTCPEENPNINLRTEVL
jgi:hypothetical protein